MELCPPPSGLEAEYKTLFTTGSLLFLHELISTFDEEVDHVLRLRASRKAHLDLSSDLPSFLESTTHIRGDPAWRVLPVPPRLQRRHVDIGDMAPCDTQRFIKALQSPAQGIQVDFDDGNCPTYYNQIKGIHNVFMAVHNQFPSKWPTSYRYSCWHSYITVQRGISYLCGGTRVSIPGVEQKKSHSSFTHPPPSIGSQIFLTYLRLQC
ncbi:Bifunctional glyoxylate cycle protein [Liparis tanakae]|uniref:Bifunctional glyoxylate cycle protein n=1 Tax=Liparis tanakae TaxID=230148 RepID=A0A4Z2IRY4_9TELE|nr:Bifunctional glyoxylate cycle protein [Liparis tanakae]